MSAIALALTGLSTQLCDTQTSRDIHANNVRVPRMRLCRTRRHGVQSEPAEVEIHMLDIPSWSRKEIARAGRGISGDSAGSDDDGTRCIRIFLHELGRVEKDEEQVAGQEYQHYDDDDE
jgi:hypothetical protein